MSTVYYTSKLGNKYPMEDIQKNHDNSLKELNELRSSDKGNCFCADCGQRGTIWSSVNIGVFLCLRCGSFHRAIGTHISKPKGCTGTYLWGPDEISRMREMGNIRSNAMYGGTENRPSNDASDSEWLTYIKNKYEKKLYAPNVVKQQQHQRQQNQQRHQKEQNFNMHSFTQPKDLGDSFIHKTQIINFQKEKQQAPTADLINLQSIESHPKRMNDPSKIQDSKKTPDDFFAFFGLS